jgi:hypothetical protein
MSGFFVAGAREKERFGNSKGQNGGGRNRAGEMAVPDRQREVVSSAAIRISKKALQTIAPGRREPPFGYLIRGENCRPDSVTDLPVPEFLSSRLVFVQVFRICRRRSVTPS